MKSETENLRELDAWCAENVMGLKRVNHPAGIEPGTFFWNENENGFGEVLIHHRGNEIKAFHPTEDRAAAMLVLEKCIERGYTPLLSQAFHLNAQRELFSCRNGETGDEHASSETLPLAICLFANALFK